MKFLLLLTIIFSLSSQARNLLTDYGVDKYMIDMQLGDVKVIHNGIHEYEWRGPAMSLGMYGHKSLVSIVNQSMQSGERHTKAYWTGFRMYSGIDDDHPGATTLQALGDCGQGIGMHVLCIIRVIRVVPWQHTGDDRDIEPIHGRQQSDGRDREIRTPGSTHCNAV